MSRVLCCVSVTIPGTMMKPEDDALMQRFVADLGASGIEGYYADILMGWGCLNQDWYHFEVEMETSWDWCRFSCWDDKTDEYWHQYFDQGRLLMMVYYKREDGSHEPHH